MHYDRWRGQWVGQAVSSSTSDGTTIPSDAQAGTDAITSANYQQALNSISAQIASSSNAASPSLSPTTLVIGGVVAIGLIWFLTRR